MPDIQETRLDQTVSEYLSAVQPLNSEAAKSQRFTLLLNELFGLQPNFIEEYVAGIEKYLKAPQRDTILKGKADELFGNVIIEFERDLTVKSKQEEAEQQLKKYAACLWSGEAPGQRTRYLCMATDGVLFGAYTPVLDDSAKAALTPEDVRLESLDRIDAAKLALPRDLYFWLDVFLSRKERLAPRTENIVKDFGLRSHAFQVAARSLLSLWHALKDKSEFGVVYQAWERYLRIVYGTGLADDELFIRHTYMAILAKLMARSRLVDGEATPDRAQILAVLEGQFFKERGIENFLEEDFFSWPARGEARETGVEMARMLFGLLSSYNLRELSEDVLKSLYQELVDPRTRHDLGEYYTPDWLAGRMVRKLLEGNPKSSVLDPSCGSGTFLYQAIREKRRQLRDSANTLIHILDAVVGIDVHPLAVIVAKTNYVLALGDLLGKRRGRIAIPVYLSNAIRLPEQETRTILTGGLPSYRIRLEDKIIYFPETLLEQPGMYDMAIDAVRDFALQWAGMKPSDEDFRNYLDAHYPGLCADEKLAPALYSIAQVLRKFIEAQRDTIWAFVLKNSYKPLFLKGRFDIVIGNPPWLSYRYVEQVDYQKFLKEQITETYCLLSGKGELITQMEMGTLFLLRTADLYLKDGGNIGFVLPRSIFSSDQHDALRQGTFEGVNLTWTELWDLEKVNPLFNVPSSVLFAVKSSGSETQSKANQRIDGQMLSGRLPRRNASLLEAEEGLSVQETEYHLNKRGKRSFWDTVATKNGGMSFYKNLFKNGATIYPRPFWFVEVVPSPLGFDANLPPLTTSKRAQEKAKDAYRGIALKGSVESRFLYATLLSSDLLPFGHLDYRLVVLPIAPAGESYRIIAAGQARRQGYVRLAEWLDRVQGIWEERRGGKAERVDALGCLNDRHKLTSQDPNASYRVLYVKSGTNMCACVVENVPICMQAGEQEVRAMGFVAENLTYRLETSKENEAHYLSAVFNAPTIDRLIKPMQSRGQWGPRDIHKKVLDLPIPQFDSSNHGHQQLAELGETCSERVAAWVAGGGPGKTQSIGRLRGMVREMLNQELEAIDDLVKQILTK